MQDKTVTVEVIRTGVHKSKSWWIFYVHKYFLYFFQNHSLQMKFSDMFREYTQKKSFEIICALRDPYLPYLFTELYFSPWPHPVKAAGILSPLFKQCVFHIQVASKKNAVLLNTLCLTSSICILLPPA